jgi:uncharacterized membrane protein YbhN (UPF0104 family)
VSLPARAFLAALALATGSLTIASLALVDVIPAWGVLFFYVVPTLFFGVWLLREFVPSLWRRAATPMRRSWRQSRMSGSRRVAELPPPPPKAPPRIRRRPERVRSLADVLAVGAYAWLVAMRVFLRGWRSPRVRRTFNLLFGFAALAILVLVGWEFRSIGWPLGHARGLPTAAAAALFITTFALRAVGWQRLFRPFERPRSLTLVTSTGTAAVAALALPSRIDDALAIGLVRKLGAARGPSVGTLALSFFLLGLMDMAALTPFAAFAAVAVHASFAIRLTMAILTGIGVGAGLLAAALPSIRSSERLVRYRLGHWLAVHAPTSPTDAAWSWLLVAGSWLTRTAGLFVLLGALGLHASFPVATAYVVAGAGAAALPMGPAGAATQAGVGAAVLSGAGIDTADAIALAVAAQALTVGAGAVLGLFGGFVHLRAGRRAA